MASRGREFGSRETGGLLGRREQCTLAETLQTTTGNPEASGESPVAGSGSEEKQKSPLCEFTGVYHQGFLGVPSPRGLSEMEVVMAEGIKTSHANVHTLIQSKNSIQAALCPLSGLAPVCLAATAGCSVLANRRCTLQQPALGDVPAAAFGTT